MSEDFEFDADEYSAQLREHSRLSGTEAPNEERREARGLTRRDLLVKGGAAAAAVGGLGALAGPAAASVNKAGKRLEEKGLGVSDRPAQCGGSRVGDRRKRATIALPPDQSIEVCDGGHSELAPAIQYHWPSSAAARRRFGPDRANSSRAASFKVPGTRTTRRLVDPSGPAKPCGTIGWR